MIRIEFPEPVLLIKGYPLDKSTSSSASSCPRIHKPSIKDNAPSAAEPLEGGNCGAEGANRVAVRERRGLNFQEGMDIAPSRGVRDYKSKKASLGRTDSACSSNRSRASPSLTEHSRLFKQLQKLRIFYLADLWDILRKFKSQLKVYLGDGPVTGIIHYHIDILQRMIAPLVAQKKMLASWLTDETFDQLSRQTLRYLETFKGERFQSACQKLFPRQKRNNLGTVQGQADRDEPDFLSDSLDEYYYCGEMETDAEVMTVSPSERGPDPEENTPILTSVETAVAGTVKEVIGESLGERNHRESGTEISDRSTGERDFGPKSKRLKTTNVGEIGQKARQQATSERENHKSDDGLSTAKALDAYSGQSVWQEAPYKTRESQSVGALRCKHKFETLEKTSFEKIISSLLSTQHSCTDEYSSFKKPVEVQGGEGGDFYQHCRSPCSSRVKELAGSPGNDEGGGDFYQHHRPAERVSVHMFSAVLDTGKKRCVLYHPAHFHENLRMSDRQFCHSGVYRRCLGGDIRWHIEDGGFHWRSCTGLSGGAIFPCPDRIKDGGLGGGVFRCSEENVFVKLFFDFVDDKRFRAKPKDPSLRLSKFLLKKRRSGHRKRGNSHYCCSKGPAGDDRVRGTGNQHSTPLHAYEDLYKEICRRVN